MKIDQFILLNNCKYIRHISEKESWPNIQKLGLLSTAALLDACGKSGSERNIVESQLRTGRIPIEHPVCGKIWIRDQDPMVDRPSEGIILKNLLEPGVSTQQWFEFLNHKTFFWVTKNDFLNMLCARLYRNKPHWIITIDTRKLLEKYADKASVSDQNSGSLYSKKIRGPSTFKPFLPCPPKNNIKELTIENGVTNIEEFTVSVIECVGTWRNDQKVCDEKRKIWPTQ